MHKIIMILTWLNKMISWYMICWNHYLYYQWFIILLKICEWYYNLLTIRIKFVATDIIIIFDYWILQKFSNDYWSYDKCNAYNDNAHNMGAYI